MTFADRAIAFHQQLTYTGQPLPAGIRILNPFAEPGGAREIAAMFYRKFFSDNKPRHIILGINPGRFGGGLTGIPFTDTKRLVSACGIPYAGKTSHELSSVFIYDMIAAYGGTEAFYSSFFINSPCPLGFTAVDEKGKEKNYNYYDSPALAQAVKGFMTESVGKLIHLGIKTKTCFCLGTGKNEKFLNKLNDEHGFFGKIIALEHPRFIMQYKLKQKQFYIDKYLAALGAVK